MLAVAQQEVTLQGDLSAEGSKLSTDIELGIQVVTLNIGGRNTNPLEFLLEGDDSEIGQQAISSRVQATEAMVDTACGPAAMPSEQRALVNKILDSIYGAEDRQFVDTLLHARTWATVYEQVRHEKSGFFNALNLASLKANRPAPLEAPNACCDFESAEDFLRAWALWYDSLEESVLPKADAQKKAEKKELLVPDAFAGLLVFDLLCLAAVQRMFPTETFKKAAEFAESLPFATSSQKHAAAAAFLDRQRAAIVLVQEARSLDEHPAIASRYQRLDHRWGRKQVGRIET